MVISWHILILVFLIRVIDTTKLYSGQRIFNDYHMIDFIDPAKHGFHIILDQNFVEVHLQPTKLPTVFATAIPLKRPDWIGKNSNQTGISKISPIQTPETKRLTKTLYPENVGPDEGLLDGHTIKLMGLQEKSWYYVCVEFESNYNRHEMATGLSCQLRRTLDKFGKSVQSMITDIELLEITQRSITVQFRVEVDFPLSLTVYLDQTGSNAGVAVPAQKFILDKSKIITVVFGPILDPDSSYGQLCILEEPLLDIDVYTAMGRAIRATMENCYFGDLKTKPARPEQMAYQEHFHMADQEIPKIRQGGYRRSGATRLHIPFLLILVTFGIVMLFGKVV